jgi:hypothetical protein
MILLCILEKTRYHSEIPLGLLDFISVNFWNCHLINEVSLYFVVVSMFQNSASTLSAKVTNLYVMFSTSPFLFSWPSLIIYSEVAEKASVIFSLFQIILSTKNCKEAINTLPSGG